MLITDGYLFPEDIFIPQQCRHFSTRNVTSVRLRREYNDMKRVAVSQLNTETQRTLDVVVNNC